ncbi:UNVERIFIED_CONTAM: hypothetical protein RF648_20375 [Kocuria sp. CPCC 205274]|uniref:Uncharacterized protein n=1 Tax=Herbiconiux daphne TaxID=2970914 RepID=A0ABT2H9X1_9MICO|nr:hypothetical protein [Herbiconiux daphne]MCS5736676.1 hypothetical protein [Herbiconiux daphne]
MQKTITIYVVKQVVAEGETAKEVKFTTQREAKAATELLAKFDVETEIEKAKHTFEIA